MRGYFAANRISEDEKSNILSQHKTLYNGYQTLNPEIPNTQPLYVQDFAKDKVGAVMGNKGNVKGYTNMGINEQSFPYGKSIVSEGECSECGGMMQEGECSECGYKMEEGMCSECGGMMQEGECSECGYKMEEIDEMTGKLDDIYDEEDLDPNAGFDYVKGATNKTNAFHLKEQMMKTPIGKVSAIGNMEEQGGNTDDMDVDDVEPAYDFVSNGPMDGGDVYPVNELDEDSFDDLINADSELEYDRDNLEQEEYEMMESAWADDDEFVDYNMGNKEKGQLPNPKKYIDIDVDDEFVDYNMGNKEKGQLPNPKKYFDIELDEVDISGSQGVYGDMDPAYDFDSEGPGKGGPYQEYHGQTVSNEEGEVDEQWAQLARIAVPMAASYIGSKLADNNEGEVKEGDNDEDFEKDDRSWEEIAISTGGDEFGYVDEDIRESLIIQRNRIMEMMNRMKVIK